jgi:hypothetical protein
MHTHLGALLRQNPAKLHQVVERLARRERRAPPARTINVSHVRTRHATTTHIELCGRTTRCSPCSGGERSAPVGGALGACCIGCAPIVGVGGCCACALVGVGGCPGVGGGRGIACGGSSSCCAWVWACDGAGPGAPRWFAVGRKSIAVLGSEGCDGWTCEGPARDDGRLSCACDECGRGGAIGPLTTWSGGWRGDMRMACWG